MNDELSQTTPAPIVLKLKKFDDHHPNVILPHTSHLSLETLDESNSISSTNQSSSPMTSPSTLRVKFKKSFRNGNNEYSDDEYANSTSSEILTRPAKRCKKSSSNDNHTISPNDQISSQEIKSEHGMISEQSASSPLVLKIRRDSLTTTTSPSGISSASESDSNRQLLLKLKKNEHGEIVNSHSSMSTEFILAETNSTSSNEQLATYVESLHSNGHHDQHFQPVSIQSNHLSSSSPPITNMLANLSDNHHINQVPVVSTLPTSDQTSETHTKELLDEALDSVKNVLMQTFKKNLESGGDLNALKNSLGSDEVAEVFLAKLRQSLKRDTTTTSTPTTPSNTENESKSHDTSMEMETQRCETPTAMISPMMNVVSSPSASSPLLPPLSAMLTKTTSPSMILPLSPQSQSSTTPSNNSKRKSSTPSTNPNRFDGATEEELAKRQLSDILQPNLDIVFVGVNPSLYAVHKGHHYGGPGNHFWKLLHMSGLIPTAFIANDDYRMPQYGIGFTNIVQRPTKAGSDITKDEITTGAEVLAQKIKMFRPKIVAFNGRGIYEVYAGNKHFHYGKQPELFPGTDTHVFVMPSSSARCSQLPRAEDKLPFYVGLRKLRDFVNGTLHSLNEAEITFPDIKIKDTDDVLQKTVIRISNKPFSELSAETLKPFGDKIPSGQMISKHISSTSQTMICSSPSPSSSSSSNLVFNTEALTTQTMSILHQTSIEQTNQLINCDQQPQRVYLQNNGNYTSSPPPLPSSQSSSTSNSIQTQRLSSNGNSSSKTSFLENTSSNTNAAVLAALASGGHNSHISSSTSQTTFYQPTQTVFISGVGSQQQQSSNTLSNNTSVLNVRSSSIPSVTTTVGNSGISSSSHVIHHLPTSSSYEHSLTSITLPSTSTSQSVARQLVVVNSSELLPSFETIRSQLNGSAKDHFLSSQTSSSSTNSATTTTKPTLILVPSGIKQVASNVIIPKLTNQSKLATALSIDKRPTTVVSSASSSTSQTHSTDECLFVRYERESSSNSTDQFRFSFVIDEHSPSLQKRLRYVSINDL